MKKLLSFIIIIVLVALIIFKWNDISQFIVQKIIFKDQYEIAESNEHYKSDNFLIFQNVSDLTIKSKADFNNFLYTVLNNGWDSFSFFCDFEYDDCINDFKSYIKDSIYVEAINNYVNPFNSFESITVSVNNFNKITLDIEKLYSEKEIDAVNQKINNFIATHIKENMSDREKVKAFHDWVINNSKYDETFNINTDRELYVYHPYNAYGPLIEGYAVCSGYSDAMAIFLNKMKIKNYKISNLTDNKKDEGHIWNYALIDNEWLHIDLTWDDPLMSDGSNILIHDFFLINNAKLKKIGTDQHIFSDEYYLEAKTAN